MTNLTNSSDFLEINIFMFKAFDIRKQLYMLVLQQYCIDGVLVSRLPV